VGKEGHLYVFDHPRRAEPRARILVELPSEYLAVTALATDSSGRIYLAAGNKVQRIRADGVGPDLEVDGQCDVDRSTPVGIDAASLCAPSGVAVSLSGELFVSDGAWSWPVPHRVVVYDAP
jgi:hypothetical protein